MATRLKNQMRTWSKTYNTYNKRLATKKLQKKRSAKKSRKTLSNSSSIFYQSAHNMSYWIRGKKAKRHNLYT